MQKLKIAAFAAVFTVISGAAMAAGYARDPAFADTRDPNSSPTWSQRGWNQGYDSYASGGWNRGGTRGYDAYGSGRMQQWQAQSGGNGSPVSAGSVRGSTDRSSPNSPYASGPYGDGR